MPVVTHEGRTVRFYDDLIRDKIVLIDFVYARCQEICPLMTARLAQVQRELGERVGRDIFMYSISLDPEHDTPEVLRDYVRRFKVGPGWTFLTGRPEDIAVIRHKLGERSRTLAEHRSDAVLGNDATGQWMRTPVFDDYQRIVRRIQEMDPQWYAKPRPEAVARTYGALDTVYDIGDQPGLYLFKKACASCHTIGGGELIGPDLAGLTKRRDRDWLTRFLMDPTAMRKRGDPIALALYERYEGTPMPYLGLSKGDVADLLNYVDARTLAPMPVTEDAASLGPEGPPSGLDDVALLATPRPLPEFHLLDHNGEDFGVAQLRGGWAVLAFGYTSCPDVCPDTLLVLARMHRKLAAAGHGDAVRVVFVSVDPARDTPGGLREYTRYFDPDFLSATGEPEQLRRLTQAVGASFTVPTAHGSGDYAVSHSADLYLVGPGGGLRAVLYAPHRAQALATALEAITSTRADGTAPQASVGAGLGGPQRGTESMRR